ncbi:hypothetical protein Ssi03_26020 [Sphaerisporangium siamense]|uniref:Peptidoglycan hydrolase-like protein with peptidoglycan-binding domain n=1 Tax=Sphaerisporangium siamense TaxID=795645 RepID=A0A7W7D676_9ACTN|nr:CHAP domain-containing protein [Sphaerisporangium siamense]MBB4700070.1 peptidoglycan hydrolase-like protein with peptidoglycan-binding domain [Sphaerisporangium siamense]GII84612.1 hypothetical protein Ssi03_26020 [Sphaerisporangium siamense]
MTTSPDRALLAIMASQKGYQERISGWTKFGQWYEDLKDAPGFAEAPWCQMSISWAAEQAGIPESVIPRMAYTPYAAQWFADRGRWGRTPRVGGLVFFDWGGSHDIGKIDHVGLVRGILPDGRILTLEGNTANQLLERRRSLAGVAGFGYPDYGAVKTQTWTEKLMDSLPVLKLGTVGFIVKTVRACLFARGRVPISAYGAPEKLKAWLESTRYDTQLVELVEAFQVAEGLHADGEVGPKTWPKLILP